MSRVRGKDTAPEIAVRRLVHAFGYRFRLHRRGLPGSPDLVFPSRRKVVFVHGCFWHRHPNCRRTSAPKTRPDYWLAKFDRNVARDADVERRLCAAGWDVLTVWECEMRDLDGVAERLKEFLGPPGRARAGSAIDG